MSFFSAIRVALGALLVHKGRTTLTSLGIIIGIGAVIAMVAAADGARNKLDDRVTGWPLTVEPALVLGAFGVSAGVGVFFGFYPAWKAARLNPIDALRRERPPTNLFADRCIVVG